VQHQVALVSRSKFGVSGVAVAHGRRVNDEFDGYPFIIRSGLNNNQRNTVVRVDFT
jgi:hypothetical protein